MEKLDKEKDFAASLARDFLDRVQLSASQFGDRKDGATFVRGVMAGFSGGMAAFIVTTLQTIPDDKKRIVMQEFATWLLSGHQSVFQTVAAHVPDAIDPPKKLHVWASDISAIFMRDILGYLVKSGWADTAQAVIDGKEPPPEYDIPDDVAKKFIMALADFKRSPVDFTEEENNGR